MTKTNLAEIMELKSKTLKELKTKYEELFQGQRPASNNKVLIWRKLAYRIQELANGGLSDESQTKIDELVARYDPINNPTVRPDDHTKEAAKKQKPRDRRLPIPGSIITKTYKGKLLEVKVLENGFELEGKQYATLSAVAIALTGAHSNGYNFFNL